MMWGGLLSIRSEGVHMEFKKIFARRKLAAFGIGFFGMCWVGGAATLLAYKIVYRLAFTRWPDTRLGEYLSRDIYFWAHSGASTGLKNLTSLFLETDIVFLVLIIPFALLLVCLTTYGWGRFAFEATRFFNDSLSEEEPERKRENNVHKNGGGQAPGPFIHPSRKRPDYEHRTESGKQAA